MHHLHSKIKIFPLPGTQQPSPHPPALQLGITWRPNMNPSLESSQLEQNLMERNTLLGLEAIYCNGLCPETRQDCLNLNSAPLIAVCKSSSGLWCLHLDKRAQSGVHMQGTREEEGCCLGCDQHRPDKSSKIMKLHCCGLGGLGNLISEIGWWLGPRSDL